MASSHADSHDLDKLTRWHRGLFVETSGETSGQFPAYAVFLVGPGDRFAHDAFREFRSSFEQRGASFEHLVIFGQHGVSTTVKGLMAELGLSMDALPLLALFSGPEAKRIHTMTLTGSIPIGNSRADSKAREKPGLVDSWREVLSQLAQAVDANDGDLNLSSFVELDTCHLQRSRL